MLRVNYIDKTFFDLNNYRLKVSENYSPVLNYPAAEDFIVAEYLAINLQKAVKPGRSDKDTVRIAVALYHGMRSMVVKAQVTTKQETDWAPIEKELLAKGKVDEVAYVNEVVN